MRGYLMHRNNEREGRGDCSLFQGTNQMLARRDGRNPQKETEENREKVEGWKKKCVKSFITCIFHQTLFTHSIMELSPS
jgi:hypothetical protein